MHEVQVIYSNQLYSLVYAITCSMRFPLRCLKQQVVLYMNHQSTLFQHVINIRYIISWRIVDCSLSMFDGLIVYSLPLEKNNNGKIQQ